MSLLGSIQDLVRGRVLIVGDVMLDHYVSGRVSRVSEEAPVPIVRAVEERSTPGGAANVAVNVAALGGAAALAGVVGADAAALELSGRLAASPGLDLRLIRDPARPTTRKTRFLGGQHQLLRVDHESTSPIDPAREAELIAAVAGLAPGAGALILSDYAKGALTDAVLAAAIREGGAAGATVIVDPKRADWTAYRGAHLITPNRRELSLASGMPTETDADCAAAACRMTALTGAAILVTRSERGMSLFRTDAPPLHLPARAREVFDVSGAGDTVAAVVALALASGAPIETAVALANAAAGFVVGKRGAASLTRDELAADLGVGSDRPASPGAVPLAEAVALRRSWGAEGRSVGFTNGCFDILHSGHIALISEAAAACDRLVVALNTDASVRRLKGPDRPVQAETVRASVMAAIRGVAAVILFDEDTPLEAIRALEPDLLVKGADYAEADIVGADLVRARGGRVVRVGLVPGQSTTRVIARSRGGAD